VDVPTPVAGPDEVLVKAHAIGVNMRLFSMHTFDDDPEPRRNATAALLRLLGEGAIRPLIHERVPLAEAARAHALLENGRVLGNLLLKP